MGGLPIKLQVFAATGTVEQTGKYNFYIKEKKLKLNYSLLNQVQNYPFSHKRITMWQKFRFKSYHKNIHNGSKIWSKFKFKFFVIIFSLYL